MSAHTKEVILAAFIAELRGKPFAKITVSELIKKADISRNTFYYHFEDIYALLIYLLEQEKEKLTKDIFLLQSWDDVLKELVRYAEKNRDIIYHLYRSLPEERIEQYFFATTENIIEKMITGRLNKEMKEVCLLDQAYVQDSDINVAQYVANVGKAAGTELAVVKFVRFKAGEGIEKRQDDFAAEVENMFK